MKKRWFQSEHPRSETTKQIHFITSGRSGTADARLITSQDVTAPKHVDLPLRLLDGLITSQDVTAPKPERSTANAMRV